MNKFIDLVILNLKHITKKIKLYIIKYYNILCLSINKKNTIEKIYKPIIEEKINLNKELKQNLESLKEKNENTKKNILKIKEENILLEEKISLIQNILTERHN